MITPAETAVAFEGVSVERGGVSILENVSAVVPGQSCTAIIGPNGAGKTTLLYALLGELPYSGSITLSNSQGSRKPVIGYVPQRFSFDRTMPLTVAEFMAMGIQKLPLWFGVLTAVHDESTELLALIGAEHLARRRLGALSGGELQRVLLALALQQKPDLLVLDEPAAGVDFRGEHLFCELLEKLRGEMGFTQLMVTHDLATVTHHASHVICLNQTVAAEGPPGTTLTPDTLRAIFGLHMGLVDSRSMPDGSGACSASCCREDAHD